MYIYQFGKCPVTNSFLLFSGTLISLDVLMAYYVGYCEEFIIFDLICVLTSINYWRNPVYGFRRNMDMFVSIPLFFYHVYCAFHELDPIQKYIYFSTALTCTLLYLFGRIYDQSLYHFLMHILGIFANIFMYFYLSKVRNK